MDNPVAVECVKKCLEVIEEKVNWGRSEEWTGHDFEKLSAEIHAETGVILSVTTLKRLWGKLKYTNVPTTTTLNTLAKFAGYDDWRSFKIQGPITQIPILVPDTVVNQGARRPFWEMKYWLLGLSPLLIISCVLLLTNVKTPIDRSAFSFSSNKIKVEGVPNSVIFNYNAAAAGNDSVFITQSWDVRRKKAVAPSENTHSAIYYHPGYFRAKLIVGDEIVREHDLMISSAGWLAMVENEGGVPLYFKKTEVLNDNKVEVSERLLSKYNLPLQPSLPELYIYNVQDIGDIKNDDFIFETRLKSEYRQGNAACQRVEVLILCKDDVISIPLCSKGCVGDLSLYAAGVTLKSTDADLSKFGCDLDQWVKLRVESQNKQIHFFINDQEAYSIPFSGPPANIVGVQYRFNGTGAVKDTRFIKGKQVIDF